MRNGGAVIDTAGYHVDFAQGLVHSGIANDNATAGGLITDNLGNSYLLNYADNAGDGLLPHDVSRTFLGANPVPEPGHLAVAGPGRGAGVGRGDDPPPGARVRNSARSSLPEARLEGGICALRLASANGLRHKRSGRGGLFPRGRVCFFT